MKLAAFDIEIAKVLPEDAQDLLAYAPLGIACAAVACSDAKEVDFWRGAPQLTKEACQEIVLHIEGLAAQGYRILTWNGAKFDFFVLAQESGLFRECGELALDHTDLMAIVAFTNGHYLALDKALAGAGLGGKKKVVTLKDGRVISNMSGLQAPGLWSAGEYDAVLEYLETDVTQLLELAESVARTRSINWLSNRGKPQRTAVPKLYTVKECFQIPEPDTSWMSSPPLRSDFVDWIPGWYAGAGATS